MIIKIYAEEEYKKPLHAMKRYKELYARIQSGKSTINRLYMITDEGEIKDECKKPSGKNSNTTEKQKPHRM